ncbi:phenylalanine--tRNA ligase subunit beta [Candidatus Nitrosacidococcus tergens]|uniref:Phenylalanine--tRNA ligase beta subunit n=1 Tax=Candidatus Nitrosacidococcus tergens TaxID=553981 RepID=A0A7G1QAL6_9GAMM|nr:phenylalanine--tRNA ligase subunit beta [Candidatus Nitrosacidococcus tergens]CAB1276116.1 phenylalanine tRNA synthetase, beta subunit [Candidatus Nitrosacidococcus tergens]
MKFSESWLRTWVNPHCDTETLTNRLTFSGLEVDSITPATPSFKGVVVAKVIELRALEGSNKLHVCQVSVTQRETFQVVCGASNVQAGLYVAFAQVGARLPNGIFIEKKKLRGIESHGMLCSATELGLTEQSHGILELAQTAQDFLGKDIREFLNLDDVIIEIGLTPNRSDCLSIAGIAREVGALFSQPVQHPEIASIPPEIDKTLPVEILVPESCPRYLGRIVQGINPQTLTPEWIKERLQCCGIRSLNLPIDITNYVMVELGQPMHAFDLNQISGGIQVRYGRSEESLTLLDNSTITLDPNALVIADHQKVLALAGIMGGSDSAIGDQSQDLFLESAFFIPTAIAGRSRNYGLHTESSHRFERGVDPNLPRQALERATGLLLKIAGGKAGPIVEATHRDFLPSQPIIHLREHRIKQILGIYLPQDQVLTHLTGLGLEVTTIESGWEVKIPSFRFDLTYEVDLIEELGRLHGYDNFPTTRPTGAIKPQFHTEAKISTYDIQQILVNRGYQEVITYSFIDPQIQQLLDPNQKAISLANPISSDMAVMRTSLWPGLIQAFKYNQYRQQERIRLFESGLIFTGQLPSVTQEPVIAGVVSGLYHPEQWGIYSQSVDFFHMKGDVESLLTLSDKQSSFLFKQSQHPALHPGQSAEIIYHGKSIGWLGALQPELANKLDLTQQVYLFFLKINLLFLKRHPVFQPLSKFPEIHRDIAFLIDKSISVKSVFDCIKSLKSDILKEHYLFDLYTGKGIDPDKKSLALKFVLQHQDYTLTDEIVHNFMEQMVKMLVSELNIIIRE